MLEAALSAAGSGLGAGLGQLSEMAAIPRQATWGLAAKLAQLAGVGDGTAYDSGADMLSGTLGMDPDSMLTQGLGMGAEMLLDPLTYAGGIMGKLGGMGVNAARGAQTAGAAAGAIDKAGEAATLASRLEKMAGAGSVPGQALRQGEMARDTARFMEARSALGNAPRAIEPYMEVAMSAGGADDAARLSRRLDQIGTAPGGVAPRPEMPSGAAPRVGGSRLNPAKAAQNERYLGNKAAQLNNIEGGLPDEMIRPPAPGFSGPYTSPIEGVRAGADPFDIYGPALTAGLLGGGAGAAYMMGQNR